MFNRVVSSFTSNGTCVVFGNLSLSFGGPVIKLESAVNLWCNIARSQHLFWSISHPRQCPSYDDLGNLSQVSHILVH